MNKPYIICHMVQSIDGKPLFDNGAIANYELIGVDKKSGAVWLRYKRK